MKKEVNLESRWRNQYMGKARSRFGQLSEDGTILTKQYHVTYDRNQTAEH